MRGGSGEGANANARAHSRARARNPDPAPPHPSTRSDLVTAIDMRAPHTWYPTARALKRKIVYHAGPTNSGKTHAALAALAAAPSGLYAGPLRLLAMEVYDEMNARGVHCSLVTGQESRRVPGARHVSCTVEMADPRARVAVAVLDEVQMIGDGARGWAWTRALHGAAADVVHVCGDASAVSLVAALAADAGDEFEVVRYERFGALAVDAGGLPAGLADVRAGDAVVAFSRAGIYAARAAIAAATGLQACVIYGALPPETRRRQARAGGGPGGRAGPARGPRCVDRGTTRPLPRRACSTTPRPAWTSWSRRTRSAWG